MRNLLALLPLPLVLIALHGCATAISCTEIGCVNQLTLHISTDSGDPVTEPTGTVTVGETTIDFDCATTGVDYSCTGSDVSFNFAGEGGEVQYEVHIQYYVGAGPDRPDWSVSQPNGEDCPPTCYEGELDVVLYSTP